MNHRSIEDLTHGMWLRILTTLGFDSSLLDGFHHPCPICGGTDRFRFCDKTGYGDWVCTHHGIGPGKSVGSGLGINLVMDQFHLSFRDAADRVRQVLGSGLAEVPEITRRRIYAEKDPAKTLSWVTWMLNSSAKVKLGDPVSLYLKNRGISIPVPEILRFKSALNYIGKDNVKIPTAAMLAPFTDVDGRLIAAHRTYIKSDGTDKAYGGDSKQFAGPPTGGAIKLYKPENGFIALTEGIETALAVRELTGWPVWATGATSFLENIVLPPEITDVVIMADNDPIDPKRGVHPGLHAAKVLGKRLREENRKVSIHLPREEGCDYLDVLNSQEKHNQ